MSDATNDRQAANDLEKPSNWTPVFQMLIAACSVSIASAAVVFTISNILLSRNAQLVQIGVEVLRVDPEKEKQVDAAWALDLIDANAGVKFSKEARDELSRRPLTQADRMAGGGDRDLN